MWYPMVSEDVEFSFGACTLSLSHVRLSSVHDYLLFFAGFSLGALSLSSLLFASEWRKAGSPIRIEPLSNKADCLGELKVQSVPPSEEFGVPERIWAIGDNGNRITIRDEYHYGLLAILKWMTTNPAHKLKSRPIVFERGDPVAEIKDNKNPFVGYENATVDCLPVCVVGVPGTGKSNFLHYTLDQRRRLRLPTVFIDDHIYVNVYLEGRVLQFYYSNATLHLLSAELPENTWYLVDSNTELQELPQALMESQRGFTMQAASPCDKRLQWVTKIPMRYFTMSAWEVSELQLFAVPKARTKICRIWPELDDFFVLNAEREYLAQFWLFFLDLLLGLSA